MKHFNLKMGFIAGWLLFSVLGTNESSFSYLEERLERSSTVEGQSDDTKNKEKLLDWDFYWKDGFYFDVKQKFILGEPQRLIPDQFNEHIKLRGRIGFKLALDAAAFATGESLEDIEDDLEVRRARLYTTGDFFFLVPIYYKIEFGIIKDKFYVENGYIWFKNLPYLGNLTLGHFEAPMTLEASGSSRDLTFMEAGSPIQAFAPGVKLGIQVGRSAFDERITWAVGWFADAGDVDIGDVSESLVRFVGRLTWLPSYKEESGSSQLVHLGLSSSYLYSGSEQIRYKSRPESHLAPALVDTGDIPAGDVSLLGAEVAMVKGSFSLQGEYLHAFVHEDGGNFFGFGGFYLYGSWFLTGESRPYDKFTGTFTRLKPRKNASLKTGGPGAWEWGVRYSYLDLNDGDIRGGSMNILTTGLNWYWRSNVKFRFNYNFGNIDGGKSNGGLHIFQTRFEFDF
jgi:phosphate-selective porin OprO/OprP